jgi:outer membrane protein assembly factor BamB
LLYGDRLYIQVLYGMKTDDPSYLYAVDKSTGKTSWKVERPTDALQEFPDDYATPQIVTVSGKPHSRVLEDFDARGNALVVG